MGTKYSSVSISGYNASPPADDGSQAASNQITWKKHKTKLSDPIKTAVEAIDSAVNTALNQSAVSKTNTYTVAAAEHNKVVEVTTASAGVDIILLDAATAAAGFIVTVLNAPDSTDALTVKLTTSTDVLNTVTNGTVSMPADCSATFIVNSAANGYEVMSAHNILFNKTVGIFTDTVSVGAGVTHTITVPDASLTLVGLTNTQTLTNKTLTTPILSSPVISTGVSGDAVATQANMESAGAVNLIVTPGRQHYHPSAAKAWVKFNSAATVSASYNIASVTDDGTGRWTINIATDFSGANYCGVGMGGVGSGPDYLRWNVKGAATAGTYQLGSNSSGGAADPTSPDEIYAVFFGDQ